MNGIGIRSNNFYVLIRFIFYTIEIIMLYTLERLPGLIPELFGGRPVFLTSAFISISMLEGGYSGIFLGILAGLLMDMGMGGALGLCAIVMCIIGYFLGGATAKLLRTNIITFMIASLIISPFVIYTKFFSLFIIKGYGYSQYALINHVIPSMIYTVAVSPIIYLFNRPISFFLRGKGVSLK